MNLVIVHRAEESIYSSTPYIKRIELEKRGEVKSKRISYIWIYGLETAKYHLEQFRLGITDFKKEINKMDFLD